MCVSVTLAAKKARGKLSGCRSHGYSSALLIVFAFFVVSLFFRTLFLLICGMFSGVLR